MPTGKAERGHVPPCNTPPTWSLSTGAMSQTPSDALTLCGSTHGAWYLVFTGPARSGQW